MAGFFAHLIAVFVSEHAVDREIFVVMAMCMSEHAKLRSIPGLNLALNFLCESVNMLVLLFLDHNKKTRESCIVSTFVVR